MTFKPTWSSYIDSTFPGGDQQDGDIEVETELDSYVLSIHTTVQRKGILIVML